MFGTVYQCWTHSLLSSHKESHWGAALPGAVLGLPCQTAASLPAASVLAPASSSPPASALPSGKPTPQVNQAARHQASNQAMLLMQGRALFLISKRISKHLTASLCPGDAEEHVEHRADSKQTTQGFELSSASGTEQHSHFRAGAAFL